MVVICSDSFNDEKYEPYFSSFSFPLSPFQKHSIKAIVDGNHSLITAHTGSGKTVPAEFAIRYFTERNKKVIYLSPIKALSNQKFYDFTKKYPDISIGLLTGDTKINVLGQVLVMTTEILMNHLISCTSGSAAQSAVSSNGGFELNVGEEVGAVVFDEIHYINDENRGKVYEQTLMILPLHIQLVMLSATLESPERFASWIETGRREDGSFPDHTTVPAPTIQVYLSGTNHRVVPLTHYSFITANEGFYKTMCKGNKTLEKEIRFATNKFSVLQSSGNKFEEKVYHEIKKVTKLVGNIPSPPSRQHVLNELCIQLVQDEMLPAICFVFSRKNTENFAKEITTNLLEDDSKIPYIMSNECDQMLRNSLPNYKEYLQLPEYHRLIKLMEKGIAYHHSGMLPVLREIVEFMVSKKNIKLLFATESFAIGLDCPIKTTIFSSLTKFDGSSNRYLHAHEYSQMAGRAGRRGMDIVGNVIHCNNLYSIPTITEYRQILCGKPQKLESKFRIHYGLVLANAAASTNNNDNSNSRFCQKSMIGQELQNELENSQILLSTSNMELTEKRLYMSTIQKTPLDICTKWLELDLKKNSVVNKKRREIEREMITISDEYKSLQHDLITVKHYLELVNSNVQLQQSIQYLETFIPNQILAITTILINHGFVTRNHAPLNEFNGGGAGTTATTERGQWALKLGEIHGLVCIEFLESLEWCIDFTISDIIAILACFTNVSSSSHNADADPALSSSLPDKVLLAAKLLQKMHLEWSDEENQHGVNSGFDYHNAITFDTMIFAYNWSNSCNTELQCKEFISCLPFSLGDFVKAIMKICNIAREISSILITSEQHLDLACKLSKVDATVLKHVVTMQSLYI